MNGLALPSARGDHACGKSLFGLSLCAGAGGLDLGLHIATLRYRSVGYVERESYAAATLVARMEDKALDNAPIWDDVTSFDGTPWCGVVDIIHGGYPCQPFSVAGKQLGEKDPRHLWPHIARIVGEVKPKLCFFENVSGHLRLGFAQVHDDLRSMGYRVKAGLFTASEVGAPHKRERLFILAYTPRDGDEREERNIREAEWGSLGALFGFAFGADAIVADSARVIGKRDQSDGAGGRQSETAPRSECTDVADRDGVRCQCEQSPFAREDDPQGRAQCPAHAITGRDDIATEGLSVHETGFDESTPRSGLQIGQDPVADTACARTGQHEHRSRDIPERVNTTLGNANGAGLEGRRRRAHECPDQWFAFPPGPQDHDGWQSFLRYAPNLEPAICRDADGLAHRVERLRLCGNGVVPLVAAYALHTLTAAAGIDLEDL